MRQKREAVLCFAWIERGQRKIVVEYQEKYKRLSDRLDQHPEVVTLAHRDLRKLSQGGSKGRKGDYTSENILRALVVMMVENLPLRKTIAHIGTTPFLQGFVRLGGRSVGLGGPWGHIFICHLSGLETVTDAVMRPSEVSVTELPRIA